MVNIKLGEDTKERIRALRDKINKEDTYLSRDDDSLVNMALTALEDVREG